MPHRLGLDNSLSDITSDSTAPDNTCEYHRFSHQAFENLNAAHTRLVTATMMSKTFAMAIAASAATTTWACTMDTASIPSDGPVSSQGIITDMKLCDSQGPGVWTFAMQNSLVNVPTTCGDCGEPGAAGSTTFYIADEACKVRGTYNVPNCGVPAIIEENFLADVLTLKSIDLDVGGSYFQFAYGNGLYSIDNNHCGCQSDEASSGINVFRAVDSCKCAFVQNGTLPTNKRDVEGGKKAVHFES